MLSGAIFLPVLLQRGDDFSKTWDQVAGAIRKSYYARETRKPEMERLLNTFGPRAIAVRTRGEFESVVNQMIGEFRDSHFGFYTRSDQSFYLMDGLAKQSQAEEMPEIGAWFVPASVGYEVRMVLDGGAAAAAGMRKGDVVQTVDGAPFTPIDSLRPKVGSEVALGAQRSGQPISFHLKVESKSCLDMFLEASRASARIIQDHGRQIGYFHLWMQINDSFRNALSLAVYGKLRDTDAFILDLRDGFGGRPEGFADPFFRPDYWTQWSTGPKNSYTQLFGYGRPMAVLINSGSRSAKEILSYAFKVSHRGVLIGRTTAGNVLGTFPQKIDDWAFLEIPIVDVSVQGVRLENRGVEPDVSIPNELDAQGKDLDMEASLKRLSTVPPYRGDVYRQSAQGSKHG
jgi:carboxyl-terminal processing protease